MTGREAMQAALARLRAAGVDAPARDARRLLAHALGIDAARVTLAEHDPLTAPQLAAFEAAVTARAARQPVAQITGGRDFYGRRFRVTRDTLDPRPETEALIDAALALPWRSVLDLGTGTGAILLTLLTERAGATGLGSDLSDAALAVARDNAEALGVTARFTRADWFDGVTGRFDLIVSNPPYIAASEMAALAPDVRDWEPLDALTDHGDGLSAYRAIAAGAASYLTPGGHVLCEIGHRQGADTLAIFTVAGAEARLIPDLDGRDRVVLGRFPR